MTDRQLDTQTPTKSCPWCGEPVAVGADECLSCDGALCPDCGAAVGEHWPSCIECGTTWDLVCPDCDATVRPRDRHCPECGLSLEAGPGETPPAPRPAPQEAAPPPVTWQPGGPSCDVCGRQDETLRLVAFPFVFSAVIVTFRRAFAGTWCRGHRNRYWALSSLITSLVGWFGIPFGFVYTPLAMITLARGGEQPLEQNQRLLQELAGHRLRVGDAQGAIRCLEEALRLRDDEAGRRRLRDLYDEHRPSTHRESYARLWPFFAAILGAIAMGGAIGFFDLALTAAFEALFGAEGNLLVLILSWAPWVAMLFLGGLGLILLVEWALRRTGCRSMGLGIALAIVLAIVALYGTQQGTILADYVRMLLSGETLGGPVDSVVATLFTLTVGGAFYFLDYVQLGEIAGIIYLLLMVAAAVYYVAVGLRAARQTVRWQQALAAVRTRGEVPRARALQPGWLAIAAIVLCVVCSIASYPLQLVGLSFGGMSGRLGQADEFREEGQVDQAVQELEILVQENPDIAFLHNELGMTYAQRGQFDLAAEELERALELQPEQGGIHAALARIYYLGDEPDLAEQALRRAEELGADDAVVQVMLGLAYYTMGEWTTAEERGLRAVDLLPEEPMIYLYLASAYSAQAKYEQALAACDQALALDAGLVAAYVARGYVYIHQEDLDAAQAAFSEAFALGPEVSGVHSALSYLHYVRGEVAEALREAKESVRLDPYDQIGQEQLAFAYHARGELDQALAAAREAVRLGPKDDTAYYILGLCYRDTGEPGQAIESFETFLDLYRDRAFVRDWKAEAEAYLEAQK